ncbi:glycoside hydrolase [Sphingomonas sp. Leaf407]|uniref:glycoside hydrolase family 2 TIM barrel-domain containing protein n=1 Tax=unclassified Sphingomonas TaxID=196159 RepID=UPI0006FCD6D6|nr:MULTISPECIES: glycoside hydrolase family 2 TIM barrel-domain containing protein [unclassified Sphingomonas]KQN40853.1 glycoside hydrolase [Sphingomonas sp. Leaf42]KQT30207.1 glycoside hydrolase [Sphingomonas sp. Leaf407]
MTRSGWLLAAAATMALTTPMAHGAPRTVTPLANDWRFVQADPAGAETPELDDSRWATVSVPHDWAIAGPFDANAKAAGENGFLPSGVAWYRRALSLTPKAGRRYFVEFDGIMERSGVWVNGHHVGYRPMGYVGQRYDITRHLRADGRNMIAVRADTSAAPSSRWYTGSGIYRHVRLIETDDVHIPQGGAFVRTGALAADRAAMTVGSDVENLTAQDATVRLAIVLRDPNGREVARTTTAPVTVAAGRTALVQGDLTLTDPRRWDIRDPALYRASVQVLTGDNAVRDDETVRFGIREARFDPATGFWLNGRNFKLKGVALHHDGGAVGAAVPLAVWRQRLGALKAQGVNAIRTAHNVPAPEFLDLTDELGLIVMDELFDQWNVAKTPEDYHLFFGDWHKRDTLDMVRRDRNHPSIVLWSAGNEIHDTAYPVQAKAALRSILDIVHATDPTRPVTMALFRPNVTKDYDNGLADMLDVIGQNYRENELIAASRQNPKRSIVGTENALNRSNWLPVRDYAPFSGMFLWTGVDYLGEANRSGWPNIQNPAGLLDRTGRQKIAGMERESWWSERPVVHVVRNADPGAAGPATDGAGGPNQPALPTMIAVATPKLKVALFDDWTPADRTPHDETIEVYSNCARVEALLNGRSLGMLPINADASPRRWRVRYAPGEVRAVCRDAGQGHVADRLRTAGPAAQIDLVADMPSVGSTFDELGYVRARVVDAKGTTVPDAAHRLHFAVEGSGTLVATDNGSSVDHTPFASPDRAVLDGMAVALVRGAGRGRLRVTASADGLASGTITLRTQE